MVDLQPMCAGEAKDKGYRIGDSLDVDAGYEVTYPDEYKSWCPKEVADNAYFKLDETNNGTLITHNDIVNFVSRYESSTFSEKTTIVNVKTITGFELIETSSCVDPKNYSKKLGTINALEKANSKIWDYLGFVLQWAKNGISNK